LAKNKGHDPQSIKFFATFTPILGKTDEEAYEKYEELQKCASEVGGLELVSGWTGIDLSKYPPDHVLTTDDATEDHRVLSLLDQFTVTLPEVPEWTPCVIAEKASIGGLGPVAVGSPATVADELERWVSEADVDGFNIGYVTTPVVSRIWWNIWCQSSDKGGYMRRFHRLRRMKSGRQRRRFMERDRKG
jgi:alkanesulfonate monooxygenase SsuD/methylene tetrahydromethanopterin reductase-like flavin-dependent oxidoreductase (luciferase family)